MHNTYAAPSAPARPQTAQFTGPASNTQYNISAPPTNFTPHNSYYNDPQAQIYTGPAPTAQYTAPAPATPSYPAPYPAPATPQYAPLQMAPPPTPMVPYATQAPAPQYANPIANSATPAYYSPPSSNNVHYDSSNMLPPQNVEEPSYSATHRYANSVRGPAGRSTPSVDSVGGHRGHPQPPAMGSTSRDRVFIHAPQTSRPSPYRLRDVQSVPARRTVEGYRRSRVRLLKVLNLPSHFLRGPQGSRHTSSQGAQEPWPQPPQSLDGPPSGRAESVVQTDTQDWNSEQRAGQSPTPVSFHGSLDDEAELQLYIQSSAPVPTQPPSNAGYPIEVDSAEPNAIVYDEKFKDETMKTEVYEHLWEQYYKGIWPGKEEFLLNLTSRFNSSPLETQRYIEAYIKADVRSYLHFRFFQY